MSKKKSKKPTVGKEISNPFEKFNPKNRTKEFNFDRNNKNKSRFIKKFKDSELFYDHSSKKSKKLQLYNLNEESFLTHKNKPIEDNYESDIEHSSEDELDNRGDFTNISETYKEYKEKREHSRRDKEEQKNLLSKLDKEFEDLDLSEFYKPVKNTLEHFKTQDKNKELDEYETNLKNLQFNINSLDLDSNNYLVHEYKSKTSISERCEVVKKILKCDSNLPNFAEVYIKGYLESLGNYLNKGEDTSLFTNYLDIFSRGFVHLSNKNYKEYKSYLLEQIILQHLDRERGDLYKYLFIFLVVKTVEPKTEIHKYTLLLVERYLKEEYEELINNKNTEEIDKEKGDKRENKEEKNKKERDKINKIKILLIIAYNIIVESGYYIGYFYHLSVKACTIKNIDVDLVILILKLIKITLNVLLKNNCNISSILSLIVLPSLKNIEYKFETINIDICINNNINNNNTNKIKENKEDNTNTEENKIKDNNCFSADKLKEFSEFKEFIETISRIKYPLKSLDIYSTQKLKVEYPKLKSNKFSDKNKFEKTRKGDKYTKKGDKRDRAEYKNLKRLLLNESLRRAEYNKKKRVKQRLDSEKRYKEVLRNAMIEQETLKKLSTSSII